MSDYHDDSVDDGDQSGYFADGTKLQRRTVLGGGLLVAATSVFHSSLAGAATPTTESPNSQNSPATSGSRRAGPLPPMNDSACVANYNAFRRQLAAIERFDRDPDRRQAYLEWLATRRRTATSRGPIELLDNGPGRARIPAIANEVIVTFDRRRRVADVEDLFGGFDLQRMGREIDVLPRTLDDRAVLTLRSANGPLDMARVLATSEAESDINVAPNSLVAMNVVTKGNSGAEPACCYPVEPDPQELIDPNSGLVVIVDSGVFRDGHVDGWLRDVGGETDPRLDADGYLGRSSGHGTFVAGVVRQVSPNTRVHVLRVIDEDGFASVVDVAAAIRKAYAFIEQHGGHGVVNLSIGDETYADVPPPPIDAALREAPERVAVVAAAGNTSSGNPVYPAAFAGSMDHVVAVASLDHQGNPSAWSNRGPWVEFSAVGEGVISTYVEGEERAQLGPDDPHDPEPDVWVGPKPWAVWTGTSFAAPQVAARLAQVVATGEISAKDGINRLKDAIRAAGGEERPDFGLAVDDAHGPMLARRPQRPPTGLPRP